MGEIIGYIEIDREDRRVLGFALNLLQRVAMGQWEAIAEAAPDVVGAVDWRDVDRAEKALKRLRCEITVDDRLRHPATHLGIAMTDDDTQRAYDLWHVLGEGMKSRQNDRLTDTPSRYVVSKDGPPMADRFSIDEFGELFGLDEAERDAIVATLRPGQIKLRHPRDLLTPEAREQLDQHLEDMRNQRAVPLLDRPVSKAEAIDLALRTEEFVVRVTDDDADEQKVSDR